MKTNLNKLFTLSCISAMLLNKVSLIPKLCTPGLAVFNQKKFNGITFYTGPVNKRCPRP
jgi:hypothetical protein